MCWILSSFSMVVAQKYIPLELLGVKVQMALGDCICDGKLSETIIAR